MTTPAQSRILSDMLTLLRLAEPDLDTGIGSLVRKIYDPVAEAIAERDVDSYLHTYAYDIDMKSGADLDEMVRLFGFSRLPAKRASGEVAFTRTTPTPSLPPILIPQGTQVSTEEEVVVTTMVPAVLMPTDTVVMVPAWAVDPGIEGNVAPSSLSILLTPIAGITGTTNPSAFTGGTNAESDAHLRQRFRSTVFRSLAGTEQMFKGVALNDQNVTHANVLGSTKIFHERLHLVGGTATSTVQDASFIVPETSVVGVNITESDLLRESVHYSFNYGVNPPTITRLNASAMPDGVYDVEFEYVPIASRNRVQDGISNRVDIYVKGQRPTEANETCVFSNTRQFVSSSASPLHSQKFERNDESHPVVGNFFIPLTMVPIINPSLDDQIVINSVTYIEGVHYWLVHDVTNKGRAPRSLAGIELRSAANGSPLANPPNNSSFALTYVYNDVPRSVEEVIGDSWRLTNQDVWVHEGKLLRLNINFSAILDRGYTRTQVENDVRLALAEYIDTIGFNSVLQASDLLAVAHGVSGVDSIRYRTDNEDAINYAIQRVSDIGTVVHTYSTGTSPRRALDVHCADDQVPVFNAVNIGIVSQNTWGSA